MEDRLCIKVEELGKQLGISRAAAYELVRRKDFPAVKLGRRILVPIGALSDWLKRQSEGEKWS